MLRPFFSYYGGKWSIAPLYPAPLHASIVEPFAGSAGYSLRHATRAVTLIDSSPQVAGTWRYLIAATPEEIRRLPLIEAGQPVTDLSVCQEARWLIGWWLNKGGATPHVTLSAWAREERYARQFWGPKIRERVAQQVAAIKHWTVVEGDYRDHPNIEATWFVDPPYSSPAGRRYPHHEIDYDALAEWCKARNGQVIACDHDGATWLPFEHLTNAKATSGRHKGSGDVRSPEGIWTGGAS